MSLGKELYKSSDGVRKESIEIRSMIKDLSTIHDSLRRTWPPDAPERSEKEKNLFNLIEQCEPVYKELERVLSKLHVKGEHKKWKSLCIAVKSAWREDEIRDLERQLQKI